MHETAPEFGPAPYYSFALHGWVPCVGYVKRAFVPRMALLAIGLVGLAGPLVQAAPFAYIPNFGDSTVSVIDTASNTAVGAPIPVGAGPLGVAVNPAGTRVYVANFKVNTVSVIDTATNRVTALIPVGAAPIALGQVISPGAAPSPTAIPALSPFGQALFVFVVFSSGLILLRHRLSSSG